METKSKIDVKSILEESDKNLAEMGKVKPEDFSNFTQEQLDKLGKDLDLLAAYAEKVKANVR